MPHSKQISRVIELLNPLNDILGNYAVYIYLVDRNLQLLWQNNYLKIQIDASAFRSKDNSCFRTIWGADQPCKNCPALTENLSVSRDVVFCVHHDSGQELYLELISLPILESDKQVSGFLKIGMDVTDAERDQMAIREKDKLFASIIDTTVDAIFFLDNDDHILSWNKGAEEIFGYSSDEIVGRSHILLIPQELIEVGELYYIRRELENKEFIRRYETQRINKAGKLIYVDLTRTIVKDEAGNPIGSSVIIKDITARKELEIELRRTILELTKLNELNEFLYGSFNLQDIYRILLISITSGEGLRFNRAFLFTYDELQNALCGNLALGPADAKDAFQVWNTMQDQYRSLKDVFRFISKDSNDHLCRLNGELSTLKIPLFDTKNLLVQSLRDRKTILVQQGQVENDAEFHLDISNRPLSEILNTDTFVIVPLVSKKEKIGVLIVDNSITKKDIKEEEIEGLRLYVNQASLAIENAKLYQNLEIRVKEIQDAYDMLEINAERLVKAERLAAIGEMSAKMAHEIRNPLVSIGGFARLMERNLPKDSTMKKYTAIIIQQVNNLESILTNILNIAKPPKPKFGKVEIHRVIHQVLLMMDDILQKRQVLAQLNFKCESGIIYGDEKQLHQAILNILKNAVEAIVENGTITITTRCREEHIEVVFEDSGRGIDTDEIKRVYELFYTTKSDGTGLGLPIVKQIIEDHSGIIKIQSKLGKGTRVLISIPAQLTEEQNSQINNGSSKK